MRNIMRRMYGKRCLPKNLFPSIFIFPWSGRNLEFKQFTFGMDENTTIFIMLQHNKTNNIVPFNMDDTNKFSCDIQVQIPFCFCVFVYISNDQWRHILRFIIFCSSFVQLLCLQSGQSELMLSMSVLNLQYGLAHKYFMLILLYTSLAHINVIAISCWPETWELQFQVMLT